MEDVAVDVDKVILPKGNFDEIIVAFEVSSNFIAIFSSSSSSSSLDWSNFNNFGIFVVVIKDIDDIDDEGNNSSLLFPEQGQNSTTNYFLNLKIYILKLPSSNFEKL